MNDITKAIRNPSIRRLMAAVEAKAKAETRTAIMAEVAAKLEQKIKHNDFNPEHFIDDLRMSRQIDDQAALTSKNDALRALAALEIDEMMAADNIINPALISQAIEMDNIITPSIDGAGKLNIVVESKTGLAGDSGPNRPPIPIQIGHPFRSKSATCSDPNRPGIPDQIGHPYDG